MASPARQILAGNIRRLRKERGWSQETLAERSGLHRTYVGDIERLERNVSVDNIEKLARAFDISVKDLFVEDPFGMRAEGGEKAG
ncbi:MAG TPA: helix-turn-helix transcriptional regulator [Gammaproteobacteria bacterium]|nr:helix-turn-helix transcriptional regulator [Gammaproteobacteria bacterium]